MVDLLDKIDSLISIVELHGRIIAVLLDQQDGRVNVTSNEERSKTCTACGLPGYNIRTCGRGSE